MIPSHKKNLAELTRLFLKLGITVFGGPAAHIAMMEEEVVRLRKWMTREQFLDLVGATNLIPGPNSTEMAIHIGYIRAGFWGLVVSGLSFIFPAVIITGFLAWVYVSFGAIPQVAPLLFGIKPAVISIILVAVARLGKTAAKSWQLIAIGVSVALASLLGVNEVLALALGGTAGIVPLIGQLFILNGGEAKAAAAAGAAVAGASLWKLGLFFLKIGAVLYGSGYVLVAFIEGGLVKEYGWLTHSQLLDAIAIGQFTPGPVLSTATFVGYLVSGVTGALISTVAIFLPSFIFVLILNPVIPRIRSSKVMSAFLDAVNISAIGLMAALTNNGGAVQTHALLLNSPAIDTGAALNCPATDARGIVRPTDGDGNGTLICDKGSFEFRAPKITVTLASPFDFGSVFVGTSADHAITLGNAGDGALIIGTIAAADPVAAPFSIAADTCSGVTLALGGSCITTSRFAPTAAVLSNDSFSIPSNDPLAPIVTFALSGTGAAVPVPGILVTDTIAPANDNLVSFGGVTVGGSADATITITNNGTSNLVIGQIAASDTLAAPFSIVTNACSGATVAPTAACTLTVRFTPTAGIAFTDTFDIPSNVAGSPAIMSLTGTGGVVTTPEGVVNNPPSNPVLVSPANGQTGLGADVAFSWNKSADPDGDAITYHLFVCANQNFTGCTPVAVASPSPKLVYAGLGGLGAGIIVFGFVMGGNLQRSRKTMLLIAALFLSSALLASCGGGGGSSAPQTTTPTDGSSTTGQVTHTVTGLAPGTTFFWKVAADDGKGGLSASETRSFTTQ